MKKRLIIFVFIFISTILLPQNRINNYVHSNNKISFNYEFNSIKIIKHKESNGRYKIEFKNYINEALPGEYALPTKELFIALPAYSKVIVNVIPKKINKIKGIPQINPAIKMESDSSIFYDYTNQNKLNKSAVIKPLFSVKGYLWIGNYYSVQVTVNQYRFNNQDIIEELNKAEIQIKILNPGNAKLLSNPTKQNNISDIVINKIGRAHV